MKRFRRVAAAGILSLLVIVGGTALAGSELLRDTVGRWFAPEPAFGGVEAQDAALATLHELSRTWKVG